MTAHPLVPPPRTKEVHYFDAQSEKSVAAYRSYFPTRRTLRRRSRGHKARSIAVEASPYYLFHPLVPFRVRGLLPEVKLIVILRDPVERALSAHAHEVALGHEKLSFREAIDQEPARLAGELEKLTSVPLYHSFNWLHYGYLARGRYAEQLEAWFTVFSRDQFLILENGQLRKDPQGTLDRLSEFLQLPRFELTSMGQVGRSKQHEVDPTLRKRLDAYFAPHNRRLYSLLGENFGWPAIGDATAHTADQVSRSAF